MSASNGQTRRFARLPLLLALSLVGATIPFAGCSAGNGQIVSLDHEQDPAKLAQVLASAETVEERAQAGLRLIRMQKLRGRTIGIEVLIGTLRVLSEDLRASVLAVMVPEMARALRGPPAPEGEEASDPSFAFKDAAYLLLIDDRKLGTPILAAPAQRARLKQAMSDWAHASFGPRIKAQVQLYGPGLLFEQLGPAEVEKLLEFIVPSGEHVREVAKIVGRYGDSRTKELASEKLVTVARYVGSVEWLAGHDAKSEAAKRKAQDEAVKNVFASMKDVGGKAAITFCFEVASNDEGYKVWRQAALAALKGRIKSDKQIEALFAIIESGAPPLVVDQALRRAGELPRHKVADRLLTLLDARDWRLRRVAAATFLKMSTVEHIDLFLEQVGKRASKNFNLAEAITYGAYLGDLEGGDVPGALRKHLAKGPIRARLSAIAYYYSHGSSADLPTLEPLKEDSQDVPDCHGRGCDWTCVVEKSVKTIDTVGDFVRFCIEPPLTRKLVSSPPPKPQALSGGADRPGGDGANARELAAELREPFRKCLQQGRATDSSLAGSTKLYATVGRDGKVEAVSGGTGSTLEPIVPCLKAAVQQMSFAPPAGGRGLITIPVDFAP